MLVYLTKRVFSEIRRFFFNRVVRQIVNTPPIKIVDAPLRIVSQIRQADIYSYLLAIKSLYRFLGQGRVIAIVDGDISPASRTTLETHVPGIKIVPLSAIDVGRCQTGGTWERLLFILDCAKETYTIQMDSDILTVAPLPELLDCYRNNRSFAMAQAGVTQREAFNEVARISNMNQWSHVTWVAQRTFADVPEAASLQYIRGSSGFSGFAAGQVMSRGQVEMFSDTMTTLIGKKWNEWGSEQLMSNVVVGNSPDSLVLPLPEYTCFEPAEYSIVDKIKCFHFIGTYRFSTHHYRTLARKVIKELKA